MRSRLNKNNLRKQLTFHDVTIGFPRKWRLSHDCRNSILMTRHYPDLSSDSDWYCVETLLQPMRSTTQTWVVTQHQRGVFSVLYQASFRGESSGGVAKMSAVFSGYLATRPQLFKRWIVLSNVWTTWACGLNRYCISVRSTFYQKPLRKSLMPP